MPVSKRLVVCEGYEDVQFIKRLIAARSLPDFRVTDTAKPPDRRGGISKFRLKLNGLRTTETKWFGGLEAIAFIADNDLTPAHNFKQVADQVDAIFPGRAPHAPAIATGGAPNMLIWMMPSAGLVGNLELMLQASVRSRNFSVSSNTDYYMAISKANKWDACRNGKAWLRSNLAMQHPDPCAPIGEIIRDSLYAFDFNDPSLDPLATALEALR